MESRSAANRQHSAQSRGDDPEAVKPLLGVALGLAVQKGALTLAEAKEVQETWDELLAAWRNRGA